MTPAQALRRLRIELGLQGLWGLVLGTVALAFFAFAVRPLEQRSAALDLELAQKAPLAPQSDAKLILASSPAAKLSAFYSFFETDEATTDWLARLYAISRKVGVELRSADYKRHRTGTRIERYEIVMPLTGNYAQIRAFLENALVEIPVMSLDQLSFQKKRPNDLTVDAEVRLTLHLVKQ
jgi:type II secretion system (T2SS) protein M